MTRTVHAPGAFGGLGLCTCAASGDDDPRCPALLASLAGSGSLAWLVDVFAAVADACDDKVRVPNEIRAAYDAAMQDAGVAALYHAMVDARHAEVFGGNE